MATKQEWKEFFEATQGRTPTLEEFTEAIKNGAIDSELLSEKEEINEPELSDIKNDEKNISPVENPEIGQKIHSKSAWKEKFQELNNRQPTLEEFSSAISNGEIELPKTDIKNNAQGQQQAHSFPVFNKNSGISIFKRKWFIPTVAAVAVVIIAGIGYKVYDDNKMNGDYYFVVAQKNNPVIEKQFAFTIKGNNITEFGENQGSEQGTINRSNSTIFLTNGKNSTPITYTYKDGVVNLNHQTYARKNSSLYKTAENELKAYKKAQDEKEARIDQELTKAKQMQKEIDKEIKNSEKAISDDAMKQIEGNWSYSKQTSDSTSGTSEDKKTETLAMTFSSNQVSYTESTIESITDSSEGSFNNTTTESSTIAGTLKVLSDDSDNNDTDYYDSDDSNSPSINQSLSKVAHTDDLTQIISSLQGGSEKYDSKVQNKYKKYLSTLKSINSVSAYQKVTGNNASIEYQVNGTGKNMSVTTGYGASNSSNSTTVTDQTMTLTPNGNQLTISYSFSKIGGYGDSEILLTKK